MLSLLFLAGFLVQRLLEVSLCWLASTEGRQVLGNTLVLGTRSGPYGNFEMCEAEGDQLCFLTSCSSTFSPNINILFFDASSAVETYFHMFIMRLV